MTKSRYQNFLQLLFAFALVGFASTASANLFSESFDTDIECGSTSGCNTTSCLTLTQMVQSTTDDGNWRIEDDGSTTSSGTGPSSDSPDGVGFMYTEGSSCTAGGEVFSISTPPISLTGATNPLLEFYYHMYGDEQGVFEVIVTLTGGGSTTVFTASNENINAWQTASASLSSFQTGSQEVTIEFRHTMSGAAGGFESDLAVDGIVVKEVFDNDIGIQSIDGLVEGSSYGSSETITVTIRNFGANSQSNFSVGISVNGGTPVTEIVPGPLAGGATAQYTFVNTVDLSAGSTNYSVEASTLLGGDQDASNDVLTFDFNTAFKVTSYPFFYGFEDQTPVGDSSSTAACDLAADYNYGFAALGDPYGIFSDTWRIGSGENEIDTGVQTEDDIYGNYAYVNSDCGSFEEYYLTTGWFDLSSMTNPTLRFDYYMWQDGFDGDDGDFNVIVTYSDGSRQSLFGEFDDWSVEDWRTRRESLVATAAASSNVRFDFLIEDIDLTGSTDFALDNFLIFDAPADNIGVVAIDVVDEGVYGASEAITVTIENFGTNPQAGFDVSYTIDSGTPVTETFPSVLLAGATAQYTFTTTADLSGSQRTITIDAETDLTGDGNASDDGVTTTVTTAFYVESYPFFYGFGDQSNEGTTTGSCNTTFDFNFGFTSPDNPEGLLTETWRPGSGENDSASGVQSEDDVFGPHVFVEAGCGTGEEFYLRTGWFKVDTLSNPALSFDYYQWQSSGGGDLNVVVEVFNGGPRESALLLDDWSVDDWQSETLVLGSFLGGGDFVRVWFIFDNGDTSSNINLDNFALVDAPADNVAAVSIDGFADGELYTNSEFIQVTIANFGTNAATNFGVSYTINGGAPVNETFTGTIASQATDQYIFSTPADLSATNTTYTIDVTVSLTGDGDASNDSTSVTFTTATVYTLPYTVDFESDAVGDDNCDTDYDFSNITNLRDDQGEWEADTGGTTSSGTGPTAAFEGSNYASFDGGDCSDGPGNYNEMGSYVDLTGTTNATLFFNYHMLGDDLGDLQVVITQSGVDTVEFERSGDQGSAWLEGNVSLTSYTPGAQPIFITFRAIQGTSFESDIAVDLIEVREVLAADVGVVSVDNLVDGELYSANEPITITVQNFGTSPQSDIPVSYSVNGGSPVTGTLAGPIAGGATAQFTFATGADLSAFNADYNITATTALVGDGVAENDAVTFQLSTITVNTLPVTVDFETDPTDCTDDCSTDCDLDTMVNSRTDQGEWMVYEDDTTSTGTGPDNLGAFSGSNFASYDGGDCNDGPGNYNDMDLIVDLAGTNQPELSFYYHMLGDDIEDLQVIITQGATSTVEFSVSGDQGDVWNQATVDLNPYVTGTQPTYITFRAIQGTSFESDIAVDLIEVRELFGDDVGVTSIDGLSEGVVYGNSEAITVTVRNFGTNSQSNIDVSYTIDGGTPVVETIAGPIAAGASVSYTFAATADLSGSNRTISIAAATDLSGDQDTANDEATTSITTGLIVTTPFFYGFEDQPLASAGDDSTTVACEEAADLNYGFISVQDARGEDGAETWRIGQGENDSDTGVQSEDAIFGKYAYVNSDCGSSTEFFLTTGWFDISGLTNPALRFNYYQWDSDTPSTTQGDFNVIAVLADGTRLSLSGGDIDFWGTDDWQEFQVFFDSVFTGEDFVQVDFRLDNTDFGDNDLAIDNVEVYGAPSDDIGVASIDVVGGGILSATEAITVTLENFAPNAQTGFDVQYQVDAQAPVTETFTGTLAPFSTQQYTFTATADLSALGTDYNITVTTLLTGDGDASNDSVSVVISTAAAVNTYPWTADFELDAVCASGFASGCTDECDLSEVVQVTSDTANIYIWDAATGSSGTGPSGAQSGFQFLALESSSCAVGAEAVIAQYFDLSTFGPGQPNDGSAPVLTFYYHMFGSATGSLALNVTQGGVTTTEFATAGENLDAWQLVTVDLSAYAGGIVTVEWSVVNGDTFSDIGLDNFTLDAVAWTPTPVCAGPGAAQTCTPTPSPTPTSTPTATPVPPVGKLTNPDQSRSNTYFGFAVEANDDWLAVGAGDAIDPVSGDDTGAVYVHKYDNSLGEYVLHQTIFPDVLPIPGTDFDDARFGGLSFSTSTADGAPISIDGDWMFIGASSYDQSSSTSDDNGGALYIYDYNATTDLWDFHQVIEPSFLSALTDLDELEFGSDVEVVGSQAVVGAQGGTVATENSYLTVLDYNAGTDTWDVSATLRPASGLDDSDNFGWHVGFDGTKIATGAYDNGGGSAYIYEWNGAAWQETEMDATAAANALGAGTLDGFGWAADVEGNYAAFAAYDATANDTTVTDPGVVFIYERSGIGSWSLAQLIESPDPGANNRFGSSLEFLGDYLVIGEDEADTPESDTGSVHLYQLVSGSYEYIQSYIPNDVEGDGLTNDRMGSDVSLVAAPGALRIIAGAPAQDTDTFFQVGSVYIFEFDDPTIGATPTPTPTNTPAPQGQQTVADLGAGDSATFLGSTGFDVTMTINSATDFGVDANVSITVLSYPGVPPFTRTGVDVLERYWEVVVSPSSAQVNADVSFTYSDGDVSGSANEATYTVWSYDGLNWNDSGVSVNAAANTAAVTADFTGTTIWTAAGEQLDPVVPSLSEWAIIFLLASVSLFAFYYSRKEVEV